MRGQEYDGDMSEFNTSLKMSMVINKPIYEKKDGAGGQLKKNSTLGANPSNNQNMQPSGALQKENILMRNAVKAADIKSSDTRIIDPNQSQDHKIMSVDVKQEPSSQVKFVELKRFMFQLENILEFSEDEASDNKDLIKLIEQCLNRSLYLKQDNVTKDLMRDMLKKTIKLLNDDLKLDMVKNTDDDENITLVLLNPNTGDILTHTKRLMRQYFENLDPKLKPQIGRNPIEKSENNIMSHEFQPTLENETMDKEKPSMIGSPTEHSKSKDLVGIVSVKSDENIKIGDKGDKTDSKDNMKDLDFKHPENIDFVVNRYLEADKMQKILDIGEESIKQH